MKKILIAICFISSFSVLTFASVPANHPGLSHYYQYRYRTLNSGQAQYFVDFKKVQSILKDGDGHISAVHAPHDKGSWGRGNYWIFF